MVGIALFGLVPRDTEYNFTKDETFLTGESISQDILIDQKLFGQNISLLVDLEPPNIPINAEIRQPDGKVITDETFFDGLLTTFVPRLEGEPVQQAEAFVIVGSGRRRNSFGSVF